MSFEFIGVYQLKELDEPAFLIEAQITSFNGKLDFDEITQETPGQPCNNWQAVWNDCLLNDTGTQLESDIFIGEAQIIGEQRIAFCIYFLDFSLPLITQFGKFALPEPKPMPKRLDFLQPESPE